MKIVTVVGARPQFIKAAAVSRELRKYHNEILIHTGQHYDTDMSQVFFDELHIPKPEINLNVGSASHAKQTADIMVGVEQILLDKKPDALLVYGDTNSTLAAALAASKIHIPVIHVEAGLRSYNMKMPEEINRILTDRISSLLLCPTETAVDNLAGEGISEGVYYTGDVMCDAVLYYSRLISQTDKKEYVSYIEHLTKLPEKINRWYLATIHRAENTDSFEKIEAIMNALEQLDELVIFPVHPRTRPWIQKLCQLNQYKNIIITAPMGYLHMLFLIQNAVKIITDSGGIQKEAYILNTPCVTVREQTEWVETLKGNHNILVRPKTEEIVDKVMHTTINNEIRTKYYGDGDAAIKLCKLIEEKLL